MSSVTRGRSTAAAATRQAGDWLEKLARLGYASRGVIYVIVGGLALLAAVGEGGETTGTKGAIAKLFEAPGGWIIVMVIALGLFGYSAWRFCQATLDADGLGTDGKALVIRGGMFVSGVVHASLAIWAAGLAIGYAASSSQSGSSGGSEESLVAKLMSQPFGKWLVAAVGLVLIGAGLAQFAKGHGEKFAARFTWDAEQRRRFMPFCKFGLYARGVIFAIIGGFIVYAAITTNPSNAGGLQEALEWLRGQPYGPALLGIVSAGLVSFGIYSGLAAVYRRIHTPV